MYQSIGSIEVTEMLTQMTKGAEGDREARCAEHRTPGSKTGTSRARASIEESQENRLMREGNSRWEAVSVSYTHLTLPTTGSLCRSRWSPYH